VFGDVSKKRLYLRPGLKSETRGSFSEGSTLEDICETRVMIWRWKSVNGIVQIVYPICCAKDELCQDFLRRDGEKRMERVTCDATPIKRQCKRDI
jgi:hypothetical protein